ncbi:hypothetical protein D3Z38_03675 [Clostridiales bacterium]|nr:hypothetical protein [Clostridiales bacterium]
MSRVISIGRQDYEKLRMKNNFYVDKTHFIKEWWEADDEVTLITRPRRFGKTLNMSMLEKFFSTDYAGRSDLFEGLFIWKETDFRKLQGTYPVIFLSFADVKERDFSQARKMICRNIQELYNKFDFLLESDALNENEKKAFRDVSEDMENSRAASSLRALSNYLAHYHKNRTIILLDEYDTPMQEAYVNGYWDDMSAFIRSLFNATFKTNPYLERGLMTGITRISRESIFSDLNNLEVVTTISDKYTDCFGFTETEVFTALDEYEMSDKKAEVKAWYDGFTFGSTTDIYNPWSIINYLDKKEASAYWTNSSSNSLVGKLIQKGSKTVKSDFELLLRGETLEIEIDEQIVYGELPWKRNAIWSLLLTSGYLKVLKRESPLPTSQCRYVLALTNWEVKRMFESMARNWFVGSEDDYNDFIKALLSDDLEAMNIYMNDVALTTFSSFDTGKQPSKSAPERFHAVKAITKNLDGPNSSACFYHGIVLGLMVELSDRYVLNSNRESGFGRYDVMLEPKTPQDDAIILEFKVFQPKKEKDLEETVRAALAQIEEKQYAASLKAKGVASERIRTYGFAFEGQKVLIQSGQA